MTVVGDVYGGSVAAFAPDSLMGAADNGDAEPQWITDAIAEVERRRVARAAAVPVDADVMTSLAYIDTEELSAAALVDAIIASQRLVNHFQAVQQRLLAAFARPGVAAPIEDAALMALHSETRPPAAGSAGQHHDVAVSVLAAALPTDLPVDEAGNVDYRPLLSRPGWSVAVVDQAARIAGAEVATALNIAPVTGRRRILDALTMVDDLPATLAAQESGDLDHYRSRIIADHSATLTRAQRQQLEAKVLPVAADRTGAALRRLVDRHVIAIDAAAAEGRATEASKDRRVETWPGCDNMATVSATVSATSAATVASVLDTVVTRLRACGLAAGRNKPQMRADVFTDIFHNLAAYGSVTVLRDGTATPNAANHVAAEAHLDLSRAMRSDVPDAAHDGSDTAHGHTAVTACASASSETATAATGNAALRSNVPVATDISMAVSVPATRTALISPAECEPAPAATNTASTGPEPVPIPVGDPGPALDTGPTQEPTPPTALGTAHTPIATADAPPGPTPDASPALDNAPMTDPRQVPAATPVSTPAATNTASTDPAPPPGPMGDPGPALDTGPTQEPTPPTALDTAHIPIATADAPSGPALDNAPITVTDPQQVPAATPVSTPAATNTASTDPAPAPGPMGDPGPVSPTVPPTVPPTEYLPFGSRVELNVYISEKTLALDDDEPGELDNYGPITPALARALAQSAQSIRAILVTDDGTVVPGERRYRPGLKLREHVTVRDRCCQFPGCRTRAANSDLDHRIAFADSGRTRADNLHVLCRTHHRLKTLTKWRPIAAHPAAAWRSPTGRTYVTEPSHVLLDDPPPF